MFVCDFWDAFSFDWPTGKATAVSNPDGTLRILHSYVHPVCRPMGTACGPQESSALIVPGPCPLSCSKGAVGHGLGLGLGLGLEKPKSADPSRERPVDPAPPFC